MDGWRIQRDAWFSGVFGYDVHRVVAEDGGPSAEALAGRIRGGAAPAFYYAKIDVGRVDRVGELSGAQFRVVDVNVTLRHNPARWAPVPNPDGLEISEAEPGDREEVLRIAGSAFRYSRFHLDPLVPNEIADRVKRDWIEAYVRGERGETLRVARAAKRPVGFLAVVASPGADLPVRRIDLVAVDTPRQGEGIGRALVGDFLSRYRSGSARLEVGTQAANLPSIRMYERMGFELTAAEYVLHRHVPAR